MGYKLNTDKTWNETERDFRSTMRKWGVRSWSVHCDLAPRYADKRLQSRQEREVGLLFVHPKTGQEVTLDMASQERAVDNFRVLYLAVEALRMNEERGVAEVVQAAYLQLAPPASIGKVDPYELLGVRSDTPWEDIEAVWRSKAKRAHPDVGGSEAQMTALNEALDTIRVERGMADA